MADNSSDNEKIDFVIPWVDGSDPEWLKERNAVSSDIGKSVSSEGGCGSDSLKNGDSIEDNSGARYYSWDNLQYWFRGVEKFAPWVNKIHFVTWGHIPPWMNTDAPKLHIVNHKDYIPEQFLPTFNSNTIELNFHRIEGLSEKFVYFNDDVFLLKPAAKEDFFRNGRPRDMLAFQPVVANPANPVMSHILLNNALVLSKYFDKRENVKKRPGSYFKPGYPLLYFGYNLLELAFPLFTGFYDTHGPAAFCKSTFGKVWELENDILTQTCSHHFRGDDVNQYLIRDWQKLSGNFTPANIAEGLSYCELPGGADMAADIIRKQKARVICINDSDRVTDFEGIKNKINSAFESILPDKSSFER